MIKRILIISDKNDSSDIQYSTKVLAIVSDIVQQYFKITNG